MSERAWWGEDVVPRIRWRITVDGREWASGAAIPNGYGMAWHVSGRHAIVLMPMPINLIARALREAYYWCRYPRWGTAHLVRRERAIAWEEAYQTAYEKGFHQPNPYRAPRGR